MGIIKYQHSSKPSTLCAQLLIRFRNHLIEISRDNPQKPKNADFINVDTAFDWIIDAQQGSLNFKSIGYKQYVRQNPKYMPGQYFELTARGGISFDKVFR
jgi:hypothetical protein